MMLLAELPEITGVYSDPLLPLQYHGAGGSSPALLEMLKASEPVTPAAARVSGGCRENNGYASPPVTLSPAI